jgi:malate synthase
MLSTRNNIDDNYSDILTGPAIEFLTSLSSKFDNSRKELLHIREGKQTLYDEGFPPDFLKCTKDIRDSDWKVEPVPDILLDRRVEITGPPDRKMTINALNSGAKVFMADFEDSMSPTWTNALDGQRNLRDAASRTITFDHPTKGVYKLNDDTAVLFVRPRGLHLEEKHFIVGGVPMGASLFDFGLYMFTSAQLQIDNGQGPFFYLPKIEDHEEAKWWASVFKYTEDYLKIPAKTIKATVLLETLPAAFQMNEILWELKDYSAGLNCGRWDYIFSYIKTFRNYSNKVTPDRSQIGMTSHFMKSYSELVIQTCHKRGIHAMGGMAAQIPIREDEEANNVAMSKVKEDKVREVTAGHDGTWVAHPGLVSLAMGVFNDNMPGANQIQRETSYSCSSSDLVMTPTGTISLEGLTQNIDVGIRYISAWINGNGCVPLYNLMEDAATAEISRTQIWQWIRHGAKIEKSDQLIDIELVEQIAFKLVEEDYSLREAMILFINLCASETLHNFLTLPAYERLEG